MMRSKTKQNGFKSNKFNTNQPIAKDKGNTYQPKSNTNQTKSTQINELRKFCGELCVPLAAASERLSMTSSTSIRFAFVRFFVCFRTLRECRSGRDTSRDHKILRLRGVRSALRLVDRNLSKTRHACYPRCTWGMAQHEKPIN